jgi:hypothetical protein
LGAAVGAQERHLQTLSARLGQPAPRVPAQRHSGGAGQPQALVWQAEDAIDAAEDTGRQSRRLSSWTTRGRAALTYLVASLLVSIGPAVVVLTATGFARIGVLLVQCLVLPWLSVVAGAIASGALFRPWLGGPVPRHPVIGTWIALAVHVGLGALAAVVGLLA